ncbi:hypothetical protein AB4455_07415 [Vibrio sp. 10N.261.46.E12]|uniref:hypothetical protein n=1 Tax=unclassified Vibrio TaxID=2614977 RepID=UPI000976CCF0|nr:MULTISPECIES: hypothetical protein [unclassified Vibrio]OMO36447.1 hypothetical protein BH584_03965 [Vibrio sp. 10N.261.45.E1]PMJ22113.1 hypothetical protein BCU27_17005 [Vibrio sp. 10N.286.45.B6]PML97443.1 hypothetical protein BCT66_21195 [Vibrio sp. 10N.261.49.E11]PMM76575.1 hypothetical protein BCT48_02050 [Vibrio sp. 10N.261.46.F12]PMM86899.1 hypothetical protein BCT46_06965 [Vibrio sp. 10N.261.46.E8]
MVAHLEHAQLSHLSLAELLEQQLNAADVLANRPEVQELIRHHWRSQEPYKSNLSIAVPTEVPLEIYQKFLSVVTISNPQLRAENLRSL